MRKPHNKGTQPNTPFSPGNTTGRSHKVKATMAGRMTTFGPIKQTMSKILSFRFHLFLYNPNRNSAMPTPTVNTGNPQVLRFSNTAFNTGMEGFAGARSQGLSP